MNSKQRVLTTLRHEEPDRVPLGYAGANEDIDRRLKEHFGLANDDNDGLLAALQIDLRGIEPPYVGPQIHPEVEGYKVDPFWGFRMRWATNEFGGYWDYCHFPLKDASLEEVEAWPMPSPDDFDYRAIPQWCRKYQDYCVYYGNPGLADIINSTGRLRSQEQILMDLGLGEPAGLRLFQRACQVQWEIMRRVLDAAQGGIDLIWIGEDLGTQQGPMISLEMYRKYLRPEHQKFVDLARQHHLPVMIHSCGSSSWAFNDFLEMGITVVETLQPEAKNMQPAYLKKTYGDRLSFHGMISTAGPLAYGTAEETRACVRDTLAVMKPGGGYIFAPTHMLQDNTPTENVLAAYETARAVGRY